MDLTKFLSLDEKNNEELKEELRQDILLWEEISSGEIPKERVDDFYKLVALNVKFIRKIRGKSQLDIALSINIQSTAFYSNCENNKNSKHFNVEHLYKLSVVLEVDIVLFFSNDYEAILKELDIQNTDKYDNIIQQYKNDRKNIGHFQRYTRKESSLIKNQKPKDELKVANMLSMDFDY